MTARSRGGLGLTLLISFMFGLGAAEVLTVPQTSYRRCVSDKEAGACYELGDLYQHTFKPGDVALGDQYIRYGCKLELKKSCAQGEANRQSATFLKTKRQWDAVKQKALNDMASVKSKDEVQCEQGHAQACHDAGIYYFYTAKPNNPKKAKAMHEEGCRLGDKSSCGSLNLVNKGIVHVYDVEM